MRFRLIAVAAMALVSTKAAHAGIAFDTLNFGTPVNFSGPNADGTTVAAQSFTTPSTLDFAAVSLSLLAQNPTDGGSVMVYLVADDGSGGGIGKAGAPDFGNIEYIGSIQDSLIADESTGTPSTFTFQYVANALLGGTAHQEYWLTLDFSSNASSAEWVYNSDPSGIGVANQLAYTDVSGVYPVDGNIAGPFGMEVNTPEPATVALLGGALAGLGFIRRRRQKVSV